MTIADEIILLFTEKGHGAYFGEPVSQLEHALQAAFFAREEGAEGPLVVAALVHDIGHLVHGLPEDIADQGLDARHEEVGERWLKQRFGPEVCQPVQLHVAAKRFLCATNTGYFQKLSLASVQSLKLQGGPMSPQEVDNFRSHPYYREAVRLRLWDDKAKIEGLETPPLESYRTWIEAVAHSHAQ
jgi:phosphonate degradation associated HDIG domain protein